LTNRFTSGAAGSVKGSRFAEFIKMLKDNKVGNFIGDLVQKSPAKTFLCKLKITGGCFIKDTISGASL